MFEKFSGAFYLDM